LYDYYNKSAIIYVYIIYWLVSVRFELRLRFCFALISVL
jgi:hypothetical protein